MAVYTTNAHAILDGTTLNFVCWCLKDNVRLVSAISMTAVLRTLDGAVVSTFANVASPDAQGIFHPAAVTVNLTVNTAYYISYQVTDDTSTVRSSVLPVSNFG